MMAFGTSRSDAVRQKMEKRNRSRNGSDFALLNKFIHNISIGVAKLLTACNWNFINKTMIKILKHSEPFFIKWFIPQLSPCRSWYPVNLMNLYAAVVVRCPIHRYGG